jgi:branched-chain amino acid transport system substrate-binding protein
VKYRSIIAAAVALSTAMLSLAQRDARAQDPIRIGLITVRTGPLAGPGKQLENGFNLFLKERNNEIAGRKIELTILDSAGSPATAKMKAQELVERYRANVIVGPLASNEALTVQDYVRDAQIPLVSPSALEEDMTQRKATPWAVRATSTAAQMSHVLGDYVAKTLKYKRIATIATDFAYGHATVAGFQRVFEEDGGRVVKKIWVPANAVDFGTYIAQIPAVDAVYVSFSGASAQNFIRQYNEYGKKAQIPLLASHSTVDESLIQDMGDDAAGVISAALYASTINTPENRKFADAFVANYGVDPGFYSAGSYIAGMLIEAALIKTGGKVEDKAAFAQALRQARLDRSPRGALKLDDFGNPICDIFIRKTERKDGRMQNATGRDSR